MKKGDLVVCTTKVWEIVRGHPTLTPKLDEVYTVRDTVPESQYVTLMEGETDAGYDKLGFKRLVSESHFDKVIHALLKVPKPKKMWPNSK